MVIHLQVSEEQPIGQDYSLENFKQMIDMDIRQNPLFMIAKRSCFYSFKAKEVLKKYPINPRKIKIMDIDYHPYMKYILVGYCVK